MKLPEKIESISIWIHTEIKGIEKIKTIFVDLRHSVNQVFFQQGYDVSDAFTLGSDNMYNGRFCIVINPKNSIGEPTAVVIDKELSKENCMPSLESLTVEMIKAIRSTKGLPYAFVYRSDIPGLEFLENHSVKEDGNEYILKYDKSVLI